MPHPTKAYLVTEPVRAHSEYVVYAHTAKEAIELAKAGHAAWAEHFLQPEGGHMTARRFHSEDRKDASS